MGSQLVPNHIVFSHVPDAGWLGSRSSLQALSSSIRLSLTTGLRRLEQVDRCSLHHYELLDSDALQDVHRLPSRVLGTSSTTSACALLCQALLLALTLTTSVDRGVTNTASLSGIGPCGVYASFSWTWLFLSTRPLTVLGMHVICFNFGTGYVTLSSRLVPVHELWLPCGASTPVLSYGGACLAFDFSLTDLATTSGTVC